MSGRSNPDKYLVITQSKRKNVEPNLLPVPRSKGLRIAQVVETDNAAPRRCSICITYVCIMLQTFGCTKYTHRALRCFVLNYLWEFAKFLLRQNQSVSNAFSYVLRPPLDRFTCNSEMAWVSVYKVNAIFIKIEYKIVIYLHSFP